MKKEIIPNKFIHKICKKEQEKNFRNKLKKIKSSLSLNPSEFLTKAKDFNGSNIINIIKNRNDKLNIFKKCLSYNNLENIEIHKQNNKTRNKFKSNGLKLQIFNIAQENLNMYKRLFDCSKKSEYDKKLLIKDYKNSEKYKKNICEYPNIDFFKNKRISKYYSSLNNKKIKLNSIFDNINNNYIKPQKKDITRNTYETIFFSKEIKNEYFGQNKRRKLFLNTLKNYDSQNKIKKYLKTFNSLVSKYDERKSENSKEQDIKSKDENTTK